MSNPLKAGTLDDFSASLASYLDTAMQNEWQAVKGQALPGSGPGAQERKILFCAIAQGVLKFLADHGQDLITTSHNDGLGEHHHAMRFNVDTYRDPLP